MPQAWPYLYLERRRSSRTQHRSITVCEPLMGSSMPLTQVQMQRL